MWCGKQWVVIGHQVSLVAAAVALVAIVAVVGVAAVEPVAAVGVASFADTDTVVRQRAVLAFLLD